MGVPLLPLKHGKFDRNLILSALIPPGDGTYRRQINDAATFIHVHRRCTDC